MIRAPATVDEVRECAQMGALMHAESAYAALPYDVEQVTRYTLDLAQQGRVFVSRMEQGGKLVGFFGGRLDKYFFNEHLIAFEFAMYVVPEWRGKTRDTIRSIETFKKWAQLRGADEVCIGVSTRVDPDRTGKLLVHRGFEHVGGMYKWKV
jgi:hypothetical protein